MSEQITEDPRLEAAHRYANLGEFELAERLLHEILSSNETSLLAWDLLGFVQYFQGRPDEAEQACRRALALEPHRAYSNKGLGLCLAKLGRLDEGLPYLRHAIACEPHWFDPRWDMAVVLCEAGRFAEALDVVEQAMRALPDAHARFESLRDEIRRRTGQG